MGRVRVLVAPDKFAGTLSAVEAAAAIAEGWARTAPDDVLVQVPLADGGPGFLDVLHASLGGELLACTVTGPLGDPVPAAVLLVGTTAYVESAMACGLHLVPDDRRDPRTTTTYGVGELVARALDAGAERVVVGLGGSGTNDAGAGLREAARVDLSAALARVGPVELVAASDVDNPLLGLRGATNGFGPQKGADDAAVMVLEGSLEAFAAAVGRRADGKDPAVALGAGAAGGLGYALLHLGAERVPGIATVLETVGLVERIGEVDVVVTGEGAFDWQSLRGKVVAGVAQAALDQGRGCVVLAGRVEVGRREYAATGVSAAYAVVDQAGSVEAAMAAPAERLADLAERIARTWGGRASDR